MNMVEAKITCWNAWEEGGVIEFNCNKDFLREGGNRTEHLGLHFNLDLQTPSTRLANMAQNGQNEAFRMLEEPSEFCAHLWESALYLWFSQGKH